MSALPPAAALALAIRCLEAQGFSVLARNERGDSVYLAPATGTGIVRVSNHARTAAQRRKHPEVTTSLIIRDPKSAAQIEAMVAGATKQIRSSESRF